MAAYKPLYEAAAARVRQDLEVVCQDTAVLWPKLLQLPQLALHKLLSNGAHIASEDTVIYVIQSWAAAQQQQPSLQQMKQLCKTIDIQSCSAVYLASVLPGWRFIAQCFTAQELALAVLAASSARVLDAMHEAGAGGRAGRTACGCRQRQQLQQQQQQQQQRGRQQQHGQQHRHRRQQQQRRVSAAAAAAAAGSWKLTLFFTFGDEMPQGAAGIANVRICALPKPARAAAVDADDDDDDAPAAEVPKGSDTDGKQAQLQRKESQSRRFSVPGFCGISSFSSYVEFERQLRQKGLVHPDRGGRSKLQLQLQLMITQ
uniref:BACK domain-containing protein n=1 Tax=Tetradesmus obliquus TaxID=3088 RepID=A0A383V5L7_TETOB|eukprot:jgi/Sobl393_1/12305/SZX59864.1